MRTPSILAALALIVLAACTSAPRITEIPESIATASSPADHLKIADYFAQKAASYDAEANWHSRMAVSYVGRPKGDLSAMISHCRALQEQFTNAAKEVRALEQAHRQLAGSAGK